MSRIITNKRLADALIERGLVPNHCCLIDVVIEVTGAVKVHYEKFLDAEEMCLFAEAMATVAAEFKTS